jgi:hypothetical protein
MMNIIFTSCKRVKRQIEAAAPSNRHANVAPSGRPPLGIDNGAFLATWFGVMPLRFVSLVLCAAAALPVLGKELRVCADPDSMPYSRQDEGGFENRIAALAAEALEAALLYPWYPQHHGFVRRTVDAGRCDA